MAWGDLRGKYLGSAALACAIALAVLAPATAPAAASGAKASIIGGKTASIADFPSLAFVVAADGRGGAFTCTGTVISPRVILTAAHCVEDLEGGGFIPPSQFTVVTGFANPYQTTPAQRSKVTSTHVSPEYDPGTGRGDAGILVLAAPVAAPPIALATAADAALYEGGAAVELAGWGLDRLDAKAPPQTLQSTTAVVLAPTVCKARTRPFHPTYSAAAQMCTSSPPAFKTGGCFGDSGGPAIARRADGSAVEIGVISTGGPRCSTKLPNIFTRTDLVSLWAGQWIAATEQGAPPPVANPKLPTLRANDAVEFVEAALTDVFGARFIRGEILVASCRRASKIRAKCELVWRAGRTLFYGSIAVFYAVRADAVVWDRTYRIDSTNFRCRILGSHPERCPVRTHRG
jgi:secreted trypsin-like serine protease